MAGRPKTPTKLKEVKGTLRKDRQNKDEPVITINGNMPVPAEFCERERELWEQLSNLLATDLRVLGKSDFVALKHLVSWQFTYEKAMYVLRHFDMTYQTGEDEKVMFRPRPEVSIANQAASNVHRMLSEFGLTPAARTKVSVNKELPKDPMDGLIAGANAR